MLLRLNYSKVGALLICCCEQVKIITICTTLNLILKARLTTDVSFEFGTDIDCSKMHCKLINS